MPTFVFFDLNKEKIDAYEKYLNCYNNMIFIHGSLDEILEKYYQNKTNPFILVSPANSYGNMKGGIDYAIIKKFPKCERRVIDAVGQSKYTDSGGRHIVPVGKSTVVKLDNKSGLLLMAPTMETPKNIQGTNNVYAAFRTIYKSTEQLSSKTIVAIPCLGTGIGGMSGEESVLQILQFMKSL